MLPTAGRKCLLNFGAIFWLMSQYEMPFNNQYPQSLHVYQCITSPTIQLSFLLLCLNVSLSLSSHLHIDLACLSLKIFSTFGLCLSRRWESRICGVGRCKVETLVPVKFFRTMLFIDLVLKMTFKDILLIYSAIKHFPVGKLKKRQKSSVDLITNSLPGPNRVELPFN